MKTLHLQFGKSCVHHPGVWSVANNNPVEKDAFSHFNGGMVAIHYSRLAEITRIAALHGVTVETEGGPDEGPDACAE